MKRRTFLTSAIGMTFAIGPARAIGSGAMNRGGRAGVSDGKPGRWARANLPAGRWVRIHIQRPGDPIRFERQAHAGSVFDSRRGRLIVFGSDTHGQNWNNSPLFFDLSSLTWSRAYPPDDPSTYRLNPEGFPVAGRRGSHPWAMHTFGALAYDSDQDLLYVASYPAHLQPGRFTDAIAHLWPTIEAHPTWAYAIGSGRWRALTDEAVHFFPYCTVFDSERRVLIGYRKDGVYELSGTSPAWHKVQPRGLAGYHNNAIFDGHNGVLLAFGSIDNRNDVILYDPVASRHQIMPTTGARPVGDQHVPLAFHSGRGEMVALVDRLSAGADPQQRRLHRTETWSYSLQHDAWTHHEAASIPFSLGMNYTLEYDPARSLLILVTSEPGAATSVWALSV